MQNDTSIIEELRTLAQRELVGCIRFDNGGTALYTPDGQGNYAALWTRDFAYMLEYAGELIPPEQARDCLATLLRGARPSDGWIPDRMGADGVAIYAAGSPERPCGLPNLDNAAFAVFAMDRLLDLLPADQAGAFFLRWQPVLRRGLEALPRDEHGLIYNDSHNPHSPYGFTDCICKTGSLMMESLLLWRALILMGRRYTQFGLPAEGLRRDAQRIEESLALVFTENDGMLLAATQHCRQIDVWGSCYAVSCGFPLEQTQRRRIARWVMDHYSGLTQAGQLRHLPPGEFWDKLLIDMPKGEYQNGAFWAAATPWLADVLAVESISAAQAALREAHEYLIAYGPYECINGSYRKLNHYVVSATNVYGAATKLLG